MTKPIEYIFRPVNGRYCLINFVHPFTIDDILFYFGLTIDDNCQFCRIIRGESRYEYRRYNNSKITLTVYEQDS